MHPTGGDHIDRESPNLHNLFLTTTTATIARVTSWFTKQLYYVHFHNISLLLFVETLQKKLVRQNREIKVTNV